MKSNTLFYVVDNLTESIVGSFFALNDQMAEKMIQTAIKDNDKFALIKDNISVYKHLSVSNFLETYDEIISSDDICRCDFNF